MANAPAAAARKPFCVCDAPNGKHCAKCKSRHYCSKACQLVDWNERGHKAQCRLMAADFQDRLLDELMPLKIKEEPAIVEDVLLADGSKAAARLPAAQTTAAKASALNDESAHWRGTCAICLDLLPVEPERQIFYDCCCKKICEECSGKCLQYDTRCPLCRKTPSKSAAELVRRLQKHVDEGNADAQAQLGEGYLDGGMGLKKNSERAVHLFGLAAAQGHSRGHMFLGLSYERGDGVKINRKTAAQWYRRAAEQGLPVAQSILGNLFRHGKGVAQSYEEAARWYRLAAVQGDADALYNLGLFYGKGLGVPKDLDEALRLYKRAGTPARRRMSTWSSRAPADMILALSQDVQPPGAAPCSRPSGRRNLNPRCLEPLERTEEIRCVVCFSTRPDAPRPPPRVTGRPGLTGSSLPSPERAASDLVQLPSQVRGRLVVD